MPLTDYLSFAEVRQSIGVEDDELSDDSLSLPMYTTELAIALASVGSGNLQTDYLTVAALDQGSRTSPQQQLYDFTRLFAVYTVALACLPGIPLQAMKGESDEKADYTRFSGDVHQQVEDRLTASLERSLLALTKVYSAYSGGTVVRSVRSILGVVTPTYDPITG